ncbi:MAG TPA: threonine aldolase [Actinobacteria bacterium]|nr:threonine aldolase [Actinomycetota bacterium]
MTSRKSFGSDNHAGAHEAVLRMMTRANSGDAVAYGDDPWTERAAAHLQSLFRARGGVFFVFNGTAANVLGLSLLLRPYEAAICPESAHLNVDECGATERILGNKLLTVPTRDGKLTPALIATRLSGRSDEHRAQPAVVAISQVTEFGTCYSLGELRALGDFCRAEGLRLYADGARLANAAAHLGCSLADLAAQVDVLSFGGTKNGAVGVEAVVVMADDLVGHVPYQRKQQMQLASKMRYLAAQFLGLLEDRVWLDNASHANLMAARLAERISGIPGVTLWQPVESNAVFASLDPAHIQRLQQAWHFHVWDEAAHVVRWMTAFDTTGADVDAFAASVRETAPSAQ